MRQVLCVDWDSLGAPVATDVMSDGLPPVPIQSPLVLWTGCVAVPLTSGFSFLGSSLGEMIRKVLVHHCLFFTRLFRFPRKEALFTSLVLFRLNGFLVVPPFRMGSALVIAGGAGLWAHTLVLVDAYHSVPVALFSCAAWPLLSTELCQLLCSYLLVFL